MQNKVSVCDFLESALEGLHHLHGEVGDEADGVEQRDSRARGEDDSNWEGSYWRAVVLSVWKSRSLLLTSSFFMR
jgi:hypothetical protein